MGISDEEAEKWLDNWWDKANIGKPVNLKLTPQIIKTSEVEPENVDFLWEGRIARGKFTILDGDPGLGKSTMLLDIAARLSRGAPMPMQLGSRVPEGVVLLSSEDGVADTIVPRLRAAGANLDKINVFNNLIEPDGTPMPVSIPEHILYIEDAVLQLDAGLVVIDPLVAYFGAKVDNFRDQDVRRALRSLVEMAERTGCAVVAVRHPNKSGGRAIHRGGGSIGIIGAARTGLYVARDPEDEESSILAVTKTNVGSQPMALKFRLIAGDDPRFAVRKLHWLAAVGLTADDLIAMEDANPDAKDALVEAMEFLREFLYPGRAPLDEIRRQAKTRGINESDLKRAKRRLRIREFESRVDRKWSWKMPDETLDIDLPEN